MNKLECAIIKAENKISHNYVANCMNEVWESDLNPDLIMLMGYDCFAKGLHMGIIATAAVVSCIAIARRIRRDRTKDEESQ